MQENAQSTATHAHPSFPKCIQALEKFQTKSPFVTKLRHGIINAYLMLIAEPFLADQTCILLQTLKELCSISRVCDAHMDTCPSSDEVDLILEVSRGRNHSGLNVASTPGSAFTSPRLKNMRIWALSANLRLDFHFTRIVSRQTHACAAQVREQIDAIAFDLANPNASNTPLESYITGAASTKAPLPARLATALG